MPRYHMVQTECVNAIDIYVDGGAMFLTYVSQDAEITPEDTEKMVELVDLLNGVKTIEQCPRLR